MKLSDGIIAHVKARTDWMSEAIEGKLLFQKLIPDLLADLEVSYVSVDYSSATKFLSITLWPRGENDAEILQWIASVKQMATEVIGIIWDKKISVHQYSGALYWHGSVKPYVTEDSPTVDITITCAAKPPSCEIRKVIIPATGDRTTYEVICPEDEAAEISEEIEASAKNIS